MTPKDYYNKIANKYDEVYAKPYFQIENDFILAEIRKNCNLAIGKVLDLGCGTGMLLDEQYCADYTGVDISAMMVNLARKKHPHKYFVIDQASEYVRHIAQVGMKYDVILALFGSPSYFRKEYFYALNQIAKPGAYGYLMYYNKTHHDPYIYGMNGSDVERTGITPMEAINLAAQIKGAVTVEGHYIPDGMRKKESYPRFMIKRKLHKANKPGRRLGDSNYITLKIKWD